MPTSSATQHSRDRRLLRLLVLLLFVAAGVAGPAVHAGHAGAEADAFTVLAGAGDLAGDAGDSDHHDAEHSPDACAVCLALAGAVLPLSLDASVPAPVRGILSPDPATALLSVLASENRRARAPPIA
jgi:hypothetical protein